MTRTKERSTPKGAGTDSRTGQNRTSQKKGRPKGLALVDPRMVARRAEVLEEANRRQRRTVLALVVVTVGAIGAMLLVQSPWLDVDQIAINGAQRSDVFEIRDAAAISLGEPLLELDLDQAGDNVRNLPWIETAWVERQMNGNLTIHVQERIANAVIPTPDGLVLVDRSGRQLEVVDALPAGFMKITGIEASGVVGAPAPPAAQGAMRLVDAIPVGMVDRVQGIYFEGTDINIELVGGGHVRFGSDSGLTEKLVSMETMLNQVDLRCLWEIDVRVPSAPALSRINAEGEVGASLTNLADCS